jgi:DNA-binding PadR family transcriptional regulator
MQLHSIVEAIALRLCADKPFTQTQIAQQMTELHLPVTSESTYKRAVTRLHQLGLIELVQDERARQGNTKFYQLTKAGDYENDELKKLFATLGDER